MTTRPRDVLAWALLLGVAVAVRAIAWMRTEALFNDGPVFLSMAEAVAAGRWDALFAHPYHPLYPICIAILDPVAPSLEGAAVAVSIAGGVLGVAALHVLCRDAFGREIGWMAAWLGALHPWAVDFSSDVMSDGLYVGLYLVGLAALARGLDRGRLAAALAAGGAAGLAYWTRPEGLGLVAVAMGIAVVGGSWTGDRALRRRRIGMAVALAVLAGGIALPYVVSVGLHTGDIVLTQKKSVKELALGSDGAARRAPARDEPGAIALPEQAVRIDGPGPSRPARSVLGGLAAAGRVAETLLATLRFELLPFVLIGGIQLTRRPARRWALMPIVVPTVLYGGLLVLLVWGAGYVSRRHALAVVLPWLGVAAIGFRATLRWLAVRAGRREAVAGRAATVGLVILLCVAWGPRDLRARRPERTAVREAAEWLAGRAESPGPVAAQKLRVAYYAGAPFVPLPSGRGGRLEVALRREGARWIVIDEDKYGDHLGIVEGIGEWLRPRHRVDAAGRSAVVLEILPEATPGNPRSGTDGRGRARTPDPGR